MAGGTEEAACGATSEEDEDEEGEEEEDEVKERHSKAAQTDLSRALICEKAARQR